VGEYYENRDNESGESEWVEEKSEGQVVFRGVYMNSLVCSF
jgi:hypothetical protein